MQRTHETRNWFQVARRENAIKWQRGRHTNWLSTSLPSGPCKCHELSVVSYCKSLYFSQDCTKQAFFLTVLFILTPTPTPPAPAKSSGRNIWSKNQQKETVTKDQNEFSNQFKASTSVKKISPRNQPIHQTFLPPTVWGPPPRKPLTPRAPTISLPCHVPDRLRCLADQYL